MQTKSFDEISVQDITEAATVNRATFYDHYTDKFALLEALVAGGFHELLGARQVRYDAGCPAAVAAIIEAACDYLTQVDAGGACDRQSAFQPLMDAAIVAAIRRLLMEGMQRAGQAKADGADVGVRLRAELVGAAAEGLGGGKQLHMDFQPDHGLIFGEDFG